MNRRKVMKLAALVVAGGIVPLSTTAWADGPTTTRRRRVRRIHRRVRRVLRSCRARKADIVLLAAVAPRPNTPRFRVFWRMWRDREVLVVPEGIRRGWWFDLGGERYVVRDVETRRIEHRLHDFLTIETLDGLVTEVEVVRENRPHRRSDLKDIVL